MDRARRVGYALIGLLLMLLAVSAASPASPRVERTATVSWPVSHDLLLAEVVTGGASASDEWVEITNAGMVDVDLAGLELAYVTSSGTTVTRKATWTSTRLLAPGRHLLVANASGAYAALADATYSGGLAATGGALVLRPVGGSPIDAVAWGDAVNAFVEGGPAAAPPAGSSIERRPGGPGGNVVDTNDNATDWVVQPAPVPQPLSAPPVPVPSANPSASPEMSPSPEPSASDMPSPTPEPTASEEPSVEPSTGPEPSPSPSLAESPSPSASASDEPSPSPSPQPSPEPSPSPSPSPSPEPSPSPSPQPSPSPSPSPSAIPSPSPSPSPSPLPPTSIAIARSLPDGAPATVEGVLTIDLGSVDGGRGGFVQDVSGGVAIYLDAALEAPWPAGSLVVAAGTIGSRYGQVTLRASASDIAILGPALLPAPVETATGTAGESLEGSRVRVAGTVTEAPGTLADGLGVNIDDGSGPLRLVLGVDALQGRSISSGMRLTASGPLGQRDSSGTGTEGYRVLVMIAGDLSIEDAPPSPGPEASPSIGPSAQPSVAPSLSPSPVASQSPAPSVAPSPSPSGTPPPALIPIASARLQPGGSIVVVEGVVTAEAGTLGKPPLVPIQDATAGIVVHLPDGAPHPDRGAHLLVRGRLASVYGQLELRPTAADIVTIGEEAVPDPIGVGAADLGEGLESTLVTLVGRVTAAPTRGSSGDLTIDVVDVDGVAARIGVDASRGIGREAFVRGRWYRFTGVEGQRASRLGALDGYKVWLRDRHDLVVVAAPSPSTGQSAPPASSSSPDPDDPAMSEGPATLPIHGALQMADVRLAIEGVVTVGTQLLDDSRRRLVVEDATAAVEVLLPAPGSFGIGERLRLVGTIGRAYGAPRFRVEQVVPLGVGREVRAARLAGRPGEATEWRLVQVTGTVGKVTRIGETWRSDIRVGSDDVLVVGLANAGIPASRLSVGAHVTVTGIVRRPYPSATDRRFAVEPRGLADLAVTRSGNGSSSTSAPASARSAGRDLPSDAMPEPGRVELVDLARLPDLVGRSVRVAGLLAERTGDELWLDDGTARGAVVLGLLAASDAGAFRIGDAIDARGLVVDGSDGAYVLVDDPAAIVVAGSAMAATSSIGGRSTAPAQGAAALDGPSTGPSSDDGPGLVAAVVLGVSLLAFAAASLIVRRRILARRSAAVLGRRLASIPVPAVPPLATALGDDVSHARSRTLHAG